MKKSRDTDTHKTVSIYLSKELIEKIDEQRKLVPFSTYVSHIIKRYVALDEQVSKIFPEIEKYIEKRSKK